MVALSPSATMLLQDYKDKQISQKLMLGNSTKEEDLIFSDIEGNPLLPDTVTHAWIKLVRRIGLKGIRFHDLRHTHASLMLKQGVHPKIVQERLGHASIQLTLDTYSHVAPGLQEAAAKSFDDVVLFKRENEVTESS
jgi:integrase